MTAASRIRSRRVVVVSFLVNVLDVAMCFVVATVTGSAVVFSAAAQGVADVLGSGLLVVGERRAQRPRDADHPTGFAREVFFWSMLSAFVMLVVGAGASLFRGYRQLVAPHELDAPLLALAVLVLSVVTNGYSVALAVRKLAEEEGSLLEGLRFSSRPLVKTAFLRDAVGTVSAVLGVIAILLYEYADLIAFDAVGALVVGVLLALFSIVLLAWTRSLIAGRSISDEDLDLVREAVLTAPGVVQLNHAAAVFAGSEDVHLDLDLDLSERLTTTEIEELLDALQDRVREVLPELHSIRVDLNSPPLRLDERPEA